MSSFLYIYSKEADIANPMVDKNTGFQISHGLTTAGNFIIEDLIYLIDFVAIISCFSITVSFLFVYLHVLFTLC